LLDVVTVIAKVARLPELAAASSLAPSVQAPFGETPLKAVAKLELPVGAA
jgi:hypothetical protein